MQKSLFLMIDVSESLMERSVEGNAYEMQTRLDNDPALEDHERAPLRVKAVGVHHVDGSIAGDVTLNWILGCINGVAGARPTPLPLGVDVKTEILALSTKFQDLTTMAEIKQAIDDYERVHGDLIARQHPEYPQGWNGQPLSVEAIMRGGHITPVIVDLTGQAVDDGVIFPARYGSPDKATDGWYWSATVDTHKVGLHHCDLHVAIFRPRIESSVVVWDPETYLLGVEIEVSQVVQTNGFTLGTAAGYLPLVDPRRMAVEPLERGIEEADHG
jgi:hypothetical protein